MTATYRNKTPHRHNFPCPVCNGREDDPQHHGQRCYGFTLDDEIAFCTREEFSGALQQTAQGYYPHRLKGNCKCGNVHGSGLAVTPTGNIRPRTIDRPIVRPQAGEGRLGSLIAEGGALAGLVEPAIDPTQPVEEHYYAMRDIEGHVLAYHQRIDLAGGDKQLPWHPAYPGEDTPPPSSMLYGLELLRDLPIGETVFLCEGEKAALSLRKRGLTALATVCGAKGTPTAQVLAYLRPFVTVLWPDNDADGLGHMRRIGERLTALGAHGVAWLEPPEHASKGFDAADFYADPDDDPELIDEIVAEHVKTARRFSEVDFEPSAEDDDPKVTAKKVRQRLEEIRPLVVEGLESANEYSLAGDISRCKTQFAPGRCGNCGYEPANPIACKTPFCPICFGGRLLLDFKRKTERVGIPADLKHRMYRLIPVNPVSEEKRAFSIVGQRFTEARKRYKDLQAGITSLRWSREHGAVLLVALPEGEKELEGEYGPFKVEFVRVARGPEDIAFWLVDEGIDEIVEAFEEGVQGTIWRYLSQTHGRRRFNGFGKWFGKAQEEALESTEEARDPELGGIEDIPLTRGVEHDYSKVSGGNNSHKKGELYPCPSCGELAVSYSSQRINADQVVRHKTHWQVRRS